MTNWHRMIVALFLACGALPALADDGDRVRNSPGTTNGPNPEQTAAITSGSRHILVTAGPGTGKTYTLTQRAAALLAAGHDPARMAAITFTVKAADEVRERLLKSAGPAGEQRRQPRRGLVAAQR